MDPSGVKAIRGEIEAELRRHQPQSTGELKRRLCKRGCHLGKGELVGILKTWRRVEDFSDDPARRSWTLVLCIEPEDLSDPVY